MTCDLDSTESLVAAAKVHLGISSSDYDYKVPQSYLDELKLHHMLYPHDLNFRLILDPGRGYGKLTCLEQGCDGTIIPLDKRVKVRDGGLSEGLGSLSAYRYHIAEHPTHRKNRHIRIKAEHASRNEVSSDTPSLTPLTVKKEGLSILKTFESSPLDPTTFDSRSSPNRPRQDKPLTPFAHVKPEAIEAKLPLFDPSAHGAPTACSQASSSSLALTHPLSGRRVSSLVRVRPEVVDQSDTTLEPTVPLAKRLKIEATPSKDPLAQVDRNAGWSKAIVAPTPNTQSVEDIRAKITDVQSKLSYHQDLLRRVANKRKRTKADSTRMRQYQDEVERLRRLKDTYTASIPNISPVKRNQSSSMFSVFPNSKPATTTPDVPHSFYNPAFNYFPDPTFNYFLETKPQPIASGSNVRLPFNTNNFDMDIDSRGEEEEIFALQDDIMQRLASFVPAVAPLRGAENFDENGDFHGRGRDNFVGPQAKADDIDKFLLEAGNAEQFDGNASLDRALEKLGLQSQYDLLPGMEVALMPHQTIGVAWMVEKEKTDLKGGCLGDDMGLGKTVQMIATLIKNRSEDPICKTNLIVAPTALLDQWKMEIEMKTNCGLKCLIYHGSSKPKRKQELLKYDVVLTTYSTMALEWPDFENEQKKKMKAKKAKGFIASDSEDSGDFKPKKKRKESGLLFQVEFYRIILDEAQAIRNRRTRTSRAVTSLQAVYRWCLTGTPIINSLGDVYGYLRFLKIRPWYDVTYFQSEIGVLEKKNPSLAVSRLQAVIATFLLRRMKNSMLDGKRLIELPEKTVSLIKLEFTQEERDIYKMVEAGAQANFNRYLRAGTVLKNYSQVLVLLLRLRQICSHPSLIQEGGIAFISPDEADDGSKPEMSTELTRARRLVSPEFVLKMKEKFKASAIQRMKDEKESADAIAEDEDCPICFDALTDAVITPCTHIFCRDCLVDVLNTRLAIAPDEPAKFQPNERPCPACRSPICLDKLFARAAFLPSDADLLLDTEEIKPDVEMASVDAPTEDCKSKAKRIIRPRRAVPDSDEDDDLSDFIVEDDEDEEEKDARRQIKTRLGKRKANVILDSDEEEESPEDREVLFGKKIKVSPEAIKLMPRFLPSTKMKYMMERLKTLVAEQPDEKTLIVSQWTGCLSLVSDYLTESGVIHVKYQGDMNRSKRDQAVRVFMSRDKARVMLMSLKCGGVGLNLTRANNVISLDLGWSQAIEAQSFDRVHRLGQTRAVVVQRLVISDTVEDRVLAMQERKQLLADGSLGEGTGKKIGRLSVKELAQLFGLDHRGRLLAQK